MTKIHKQKRTNLIFWNLRLFERHLIPNLRRRPQRRKLDDPSWPVATASRKPVDWWEEPAIGCVSKTHVSRIPYLQYPVDFEVMSRKLSFAVFVGQRQCVEIFGVLQRRLDETLWTGAREDYRTRLSVFLLALLTYYYVTSTTKDTSDRDAASCVQLKSDANGPLWKLKEMAVSN